MNKEDVIVLLMEHREVLQAQGVKSLAVFGSVARGDETQVSDVDVLVELNGPIGLFGLSNLKHMIELMLGVERVDLITREGIHPALKDTILREAINVI